ncbi:hypothetical protein A9Q99_20875 [Gammaproteobacteria bacterium 45_16_T64]|nr:hypothetical protein A9Q99_20875 [Gammaproteobacteria bacterium 45_16_T64]
MKPQTIDVGSNNVVDLFTGKPLGEVQDNVIRISPEFDGLEMLYTNDTAPDKLYSLKIVCWALKESGEAVGMVPWLNKIVPCTEINDPLNGRWEGYRDPTCNDIFYSAPTHKVIELETAAQYYDYDADNTDIAIQEIPDAIGTHAVLTDNGFRSFILVEVLSWRLLGNGEILAMLVDEDEVKSTPVLPGDPCLYTAQEHPEFRYFFQHRIANKIKEQDPEALAAISMLIEG